MLKTKENNTYDKIKIHKILKGQRHIYKRLY